MCNKRYEESKEIFLLAYHRATIGKNILYRLIEVSLKMGQISEATEFFDEYREVAGSDNSQYILRYKIARAKNASLNEQIRILEEYKEKEFTERWSYELAKLYYKAGDKQKCLDLCNEMILWFNDGTYVMKALDLKQRMGVLTGEEKEKYEQRFIPKLIPPEKAQEIRESKETEAVTETEYEESRPVTDTIQVDDERDLNSAETFQEKISKGIRDIFGGHKKAAEETEDVEEEQQDDTEELLRQKLLKLPRILQIRSLVRRKLRKLRLLPQKKSPKKTLLKKRRQKLLRLEMVRNFWHPVLIICLPEPYS